MIEHKESLKYGQVLRIHNDTENGLLISKGFTDPNVYYMAYQHLERINNYRDSLFQILPRGTFEIHDEYLKEKDKSLFLRMKTEEQQYNIIIQSRMNEEVKFGAEVILRHLDSGQYLFGSYQCSEFSTDAFKLLLREQLSSQCVFRLSPYQTYQQYGQQIYIDEQVILTHEKSQCKVDYVECSIFLDREIDTDAIRIKKPTNPRVEAVISLNSISQWVFKLHIDHGAIKPYDLVFLHYSLNNSYLSVDQTVFLKQYKTDVPPLDSVWEIQPVGDAFVLRHSLTGQVLNSECLLEEYSEKSTQHMNLKAAKYGIDEISYNTFIQITQNQKELQISKNQAKGAVIRKDSTLDLYFNQLNEDDLDYIKHELVFRKEKSLHGFKLKRLKEQDKRDMLLIQSSHELLQQFGDVLKLPIKQIESLVNDSILSQLCQVITHLILYVVDDTVIESENLPLFHRQTYLKDMHIVNIIMQIIYFISMKNDLNKIFKYKKSERNRLRQIFKLAYLLIEKMTKNNPQVKLFISQWLELFLHQAMTIADVQLQNSLSELLDDNYQAINKFITKETLQRLVKLVSQRVPHEKYLRIFSCIVVCNGKSIINNQINILKMFYESSQIITSDFKFQLKIENGRVLILSQVKWRTLNELYVDSADVGDKDRQQWNYFLQYLSLLSDICMNRNKFGKKYVEENFPLSILCCLLEDPDAKETNAVEQILKLIHSAYIDCQHYTPIRRIARVREWTTIETKKDILKTHAAGPLKPENCDLKRVMTFIQNFLEDFQFFSIKERKQNQNLFTVLSVLKTTLRLGFWLSITQLQDLLPNLLKIASCNRDFTENEVDEILLQSTNFSTQFNLMYSQAKQRLTKLNSETIVIMKSKVLACEIIDIIIDMETNVRVSKSTKKLKKIFNSENVFSLDLWSDKFSRMIKKRDVFVKCNQYILEVLFAELTLFENPDLLKYSLKLLSRIYGQRRELIYNFDKILIVADGFTFQLSVDSRVTRTKLLSLNDRNILSATLENQKDYNIYLWRESDDFKESGVIQDLYWLVACLKTREQVKRTDIKIELDKFPKQIYTERERNHKLHQSLIKCQDLHENIMYFIENAVDLNEFLLKFLRACYQFITMLVWNHQENKNDFITYLPIMMKHIPLNVGCIEYLRELFHNNRLLLFNENLTVQVCEQVIRRCNELPFSDYYKSSLLDFLRVITYFSNKPIKINQLQIMALLQDRRFTNLMLFYSNRDCLINQLEPIMEQYHKDYQVGLKSGIISVAPTVTYLFNYFQLLSLLIEDQNEINMGKCKQMHPHHLLIQTYQLLGQCWPLKRYVRAYINRLYYTSQEYGGITQQIIELDIENIIGDLSDLVEFQQLGRDITLQEPTRYTYMQSYVYLTLEENLIMLNLILNRQQFLDDLEDTLQTNQATQRLKLHLEILEIGRLLSRVQRVFQTSHICQFTSILILVFRSIYKTFDLSLLIIRDSLYNSISIEKSPSSVQIDRVIRHKTYKNRRLISETVTTTSSKVDPAEELNTRLIPYQDMLDSKEKMKQVKEQLIDQLFEESIEYKARPKGVFQQRDTNEKLNIVHKELMGLLQGTDFETFVEQEFYQGNLYQYLVCEKLNRIDYEGMQLYGTSFKVIRLQDFIENIIQLNLKAPDSLDESLRIFFLKVLARIITEKNINNQANVEEWQPEDWQMCKTEIQASQNLLVDCKAAELICSLLKNQGLETRTQLTNELLIFGVTYLLGGNTRCQNSILDLIKQDSSNTILHNFSILIRKVSRLAYINYKIRKSKNKDSSTFKVALLDNYDLYDGSAMLRPKLDSEEVQQVKKAYVILLNRSFRFLQLLCENNNVEMKNYIRQQADKDGTVRSTSINFIEFATSQLRIYFKIINKSLIQVPSFICDFLIEVIQVPCLENQLVICKTTFFEDACYLLQYLSQQERLKIRQLDGEAEQEQLQQLYNKILIAIMSVLEGNDDRIYEDLKNKLEPQFLLEIVHQNLRGLEVATAKDMIKLLEKQGLMYGPQIMNILNVLIIKANISSRLGNSQWLEASESETELQKILDILNQRILKIEIIYQDKPQVIYFPHHGLFDLLSSETRDKIMYSINRDTQRDKILGVLNQCRIIHNELEYNYDLSKYHIAITETSITTLSQIAAVFSIIVNILMVITLNVDIKNQVATLVADFSEQLFINMFEFCQLFSSLVYYAFYLKSRVPLCLKTRPSQEFKIYPLQDLEQVNRQGFGFLNALTFIFKWENQLIKKKIIPAMKNIYHFVSYYFQIIVYISVHEDDFIRITLYVIFAMLGTFVKSYYFSLHLFDLFSRLTLLQNVFQAISYNAKQLLVVALLGVLFMFVFSFTTFDSYVDEIYSVGYDGDKCETLISCMITLVTSGVIGTSMQKWDFIKFCYDTLYFVFSALLFTNIVSGIMIDTFAELRDQRQKIEDDKRNKCFICGIERVQLEKQNINFETHINGTHHLWNYIYYMYCLMKKDTTEYSGLEYAISDMIEKENISWFPIQTEE